MTLLSTTGFNEATRCWKAYEYHQVLGLVPKPERVRASMRRGVWIHRALEDIHTIGTYDITPMVEWSVEHGMGEEEAATAAQSVRLVLDGYIHKWRAHPWRVILKEHKLFYTTLDGDTLRATLDLIMEDRDGVWIVEHKSTSDIPPPAWRATDPQVILQWFLAERYGIKTDGIMFNYLPNDAPSAPRVKKDGTFYANTSVTTSAVYDAAMAKVALEDPKYNPRYWHDQRATYVNDDLFYQRYHVQRPIHQLKSTLKDVKHVLQTVQANTKEDHWPRSLHPFTCARFCSYNRLCATEYATGQLNRGMRETEFVQETDEIKEAGR